MGDNSAPYAREALDIMQLRVNDDRPFFARRDLRELDAAAPILLRSATQLPKIVKKRQLTRVGRSRELVYEML
jgi:hypothetical protein